MRGIPEPRYSTISRSIHTDINAAPVMIVEKCDDLFFQPISQLPFVFDAVAFHYLLLLHLHSEMIFKHLLSYNAHKPDLSAGAFSRCQVEAQVGSFSSLSPFSVSYFSALFAFLGFSPFPLRWGNQQPSGFDFSVVSADGWLFKSSNSGHINILSMS